MRYSKRCYIEKGNTILTREVKIWIEKPTPYMKINIKERHTTLSIILVLDVSTLKHNLLA